MEEEDQELLDISVTYCPREGDVPDIGVTDPIIITDTTTVDELKALIQQHHSLHIPANQQVLLHVSFNILLDNAEIVHDYDELLDQDTIEEVYVWRKITPREVPIQVTIDENQICFYPELPDDEGSFDFTVWTNILVSNLKAMIDQRVGLSPSRQCLVFMENELDDELRLEDFITNLEDMTLALTEKQGNSELALELTVELGDGSYELLFLQETDTIYYLRGIIRWRKWVNGDFSLYVRGRDEEENLDGNATFEQLGITEDSVVFIEEDGGTVMIEESLPPLLN